MNAEQELIKLSNYCAQHENWIDVRWVGKVLDGIRTMCASDAAAEKLLRDAINQQLAQLRDWANDAERRCKAETAAKEAETERADRLAKEISGREELYAILRGICEDAIDWIGTLSHDGIGGEALNHPLTVKIRQKMQRMYEHPIDNKLLKRADQIEAAEERADRAERAQGWISIEDRTPAENGEYLVVCEVGVDCCDYFLGSMSWETMRSYGIDSETHTRYGVTHWMPLPLSPTPSPAKPDKP